MVVNNALSVNDNCLQTCNVTCICPLNINQYVYSEDEGRKKWKYLRDKYIKERKAEREKRSGSEGGSQREWKFTNALSVLERFVKERPTSSNIPQASDQLGSECNEVAFYRSLKSEVWILYKKYEELSVFV